MAKPKIKLDTTKIKSFLVNHVEKIVFGGFALCCLLLLYGAFGLERVTQTPSELSQLAQRARTNIDGSTFDLEQSGIKVVEYADKAKAVTQKVTLDGFEWKPVDPPVWPAGNKRSQPQLLALEDLKVSTGVGAFDLKPKGQVAAAPAAAPAASPPAGGGTMPRAGGATPRRGMAIGGGGMGANAAATGNAEGKPYAVIVGLVPVDRQAKEFAETFRGVSMPMEGDQSPRYKPIRNGIAAQVERAEVIPGVADNDLKWQWIDASAANATEKARYNGNSMEVADASVIDPAVTEPLPPLVGSEWDAQEITNEKLPLAPKREAAVAAADPMPMPMPAPAAGEEADPLAAAPVAAPEAAAAAAEAEAEPAAGSSPYLLFRYFDFTAEPGKTYRYRVWLVLENPNFGVNTDYLTEPELAANDYMRTAATAASDAVTIPFDGTLLAGELVTPTSDRELGTSVVLEQWLPTGGKAIAVVPIAFRGQLLNQQSDKVMLTDSGGGNPRMGEKGKAVDFRTETTVLDMRSEGEGRDQPATLLVLDPSGRLKVRKAEPRFGEIEKQYDEAERASKRKDKDKDEDALSSDKKGRMPAAGGMAGQQDDKKPRRGRRGNDDGGR